MGVSAITYTEIKSFFELYSIEYEPWEVEVIKMFDRVALEVTAEQHARAEKNKNSK